MLVHILTRIINDKVLHARWLNTLSFMEYVGARKIMKSQDENSIDDEVLEHMAEEIHHAHFLKKAIRKYLSQDATSFAELNLLAKSAAITYFQQLDAMSAERACSARHAYLLTSYIVETRALDLYTTYEKLLRDQRLFRLTSIVCQERRHLHEIRDKLVQIDQHFLTIESELLTKEAKCFSEWLLTLAREIEEYDSQPH